MVRIRKVTEHRRGAEHGDGGAEEAKPTQLEEC
jgi:hypothetical protein